MKPIDRDAFSELVKTARISLRLRRELRFVPEEITDWSDRDFLAVMNKSRSEGVLIASLDTQYVVPFHLQRRMPNRSGRVEAIVCDICATWQRGSNSAILTFPRGKSSTSFLVCADLNCSLHVRNKTPESTLSRTQLRENNTMEDRIGRLRFRLQAILAH